MSETTTEKPTPAPRSAENPASKPRETPVTRPAPPIGPNPKLDHLVEKGGPKRVPLPEWLKKLV